nr:hypothetical protein Iba_chr01cCG6420 [Ipomoea batatas]
MTTAFPLFIFERNSSRLCFSSITVSADVMHPLQAKQSLREILTGSFCTDGLAALPTLPKPSDFSSLLEFALRETTQPWDGAM